MTKALLTWYQENQRNLPWRKNKDPYKIWVSEIILQQTQIKTGIKYYHEFINTFPTVHKLASAKDISVLKVWEGLGYYNRALNMLITAKIVVEKYNGIFPKEYDTLIALKGIGPYTAAAISSICNKEKKAVLDGNVYRVLSRLYNIDTPINTTEGKHKFQEIADKLISPTSPGTYNQAIMDFGSIHCKKHNPKCESCPFKKICVAFKLGTTNVRPVKKEKEKSAIRHFNYLFITNNSFFIIQQRNDNDIWKKLYELPLIETEKKMSKTILRKEKYLRSFEILNIEKNYNMQHNLSHQKLKISFWRIDVNDINIKSNIQKIHINEIDKYPFPKPLKKYLKIR